MVAVGRFHGRDLAVGGGVWQVEVAQCALARAIVADLRAPSGLKARSYADTEPRSSDSNEQALNGLADLRVVLSDRDKQLTATSTKQKRRKLDEKDQHFT